MTRPNKKNRVKVENVMHAQMYDCIQQNTPESGPQRPYRDEEESSSSSFSETGDFPSDFTTSDNATQQCERPRDNGHSNSNGKGNNKNEKKMEALEMDTGDRIRIQEPQRHHQHHRNNNTKKGPSNENLLGTAFVTFMGFALIQTVVAIFAKSEAMLGDSAAMIVDALTYLFNYYAEHKKAKYEQQIEDDDQEEEEGEDDNGVVGFHPTPPSGKDSNDNHDNITDMDSSMRKRRVMERTKRKMVLKLELIPPCISVSTLLIVTAVVLHHSIKVLILDSHRDINLQGNPNIHIMMYFSIANLLLDIINVANFAKAKHLFGYETHEHPMEDPRHYTHTAIQTDDEDDNDVDDEERHCATSRSSSEDYDESQDQTANLNMCSAYTHVFADTLRSIAVLIAACISELVTRVTPEEADAAAAVVVSGLIILSLIPLLQGLLQTFQELRMIRAEEKSDELLFLT